MCAYRGLRGVLHEGDHWQDAENKVESDERLYARRSMAVNAHGMICVEIKLTERIGRVRKEVKR